MAAGWGGDRHDALLAPTPPPATAKARAGAGKKTKEKRKYVRKVPYGTGGKSEDKIAKRKKKKGAKAAPPGGAKRGMVAEKNDGVKLTKKKTADNGKAIVRKEKKKDKADGDEQTKKEKADGDGQMKKEKAEEDVGTAKTQKKKKKVRDDGKEVSYKKVADTDGKATTKTKLADVNGKAADKKKKADVEGGDRNTKKAGEKSAATTPKTKRKAMASMVSVLESSTSPDKKERKTKGSAAISALESATGMEGSTKSKSKDTDSKSPPSPKETTKTPPPPPPETSEEKEKASLLHALYKRRYNACVRQIKEMTSDELPRKAPKKKNTMKVSVNIPPDKEIGDDITFGCVGSISPGGFCVRVLSFSCWPLTRIFPYTRPRFRNARTKPDENAWDSNPNVPGQKLKVKIPKNADMEKRSFIVSIPMPKVKEEVQPPALNNFPKEFRETLYSYSLAYDDWCDAEGSFSSLSLSPSLSLSLSLSRRVHGICGYATEIFTSSVFYYSSLLPEGKYNETLPAIKRKQFKPAGEKLKKFDEMLEEFPNNLATPVDLTLLRKIVRWERSNKQRREKRKSGEGVGAASPSTTNAATKLQQPQDVMVNVPRSGTDFPIIIFDKRDFPED